MKPVNDRQEWDDVLDFWFPEGRSLDVDARTHRAYWRWRMQGGADDEIVSRFSDLTRRAAQGALDYWALEAEGRLALIIVLDQFSRSVWRGRDQAYMQDPHALSLAMKGFSNRHYSFLETPWFKVVHGLPLGHCEGPDHLRRLDRLISDISDASRLDAEMARQDAVPIDVARILEAVVEVQREIAAPDGPQITLDVAKSDQDDAYVVLGHDSRLGQVFTNLIDNARSFTPKDGGVRVLLRRNGAAVDIVVEDDGPGIRAEQVERIFERFYTDRPEQEAFGQNSGLGLSISRQIVEAHRGRIWAENRLKPRAAKDDAPVVLCARFTVRLPGAAA